MADFGDRAQHAQQVAEEAAFALRAKRPAVAGTAHCMECGDPIDPRRRAAMPSARLCIACQTDAES